MERYQFEELKHRFRFWSISVRTENAIKGGEADYEKATALLLDDFRSGRIGELPERPDEITED